MKVKVSIPEAEMNAISPRTPSLIRVEAIERSFSGGLIEKGVTADALTHTYDVRINVPNADRRLLPGMVASVRFAAAEPESGQALHPACHAVQRRITILCLYGQWLLTAQPIAQRLALV